MSLFFVKLSLDFSLMITSIRFISSSQQFGYPLSTIHHNII